MAALSTIAMIALGAYSAYSTYETGKKSAEATERAGAQVAEATKKQADQAEQATNRANAKKPDIAALMGANIAATKGGQGGTMLTGPQGIDPTALQLGRNTLLGA